MAWISRDGPTGGEFTLSDGDQIQAINGDGTWVIRAHTTGRPLTLAVKDGNGSLTLHGFGNVVVSNLKNGPGDLVICEDCTSADIRFIDGPGQVYLRNAGQKTIHGKNGAGNVWFRGQPPVVDGPWDGPGQQLREP